MRNMLQAMLIACVAVSLAPAAHAQGADEAARCEHRFDELRGLFGRVFASEDSVYERVDRIATRLDELAVSGQPVCLEGESEGCVEAEASLTTNHNDGNDLDTAYAAFRAQRRQYNEYLAFFDTACVEAGHGSWGAGESPPPWSEDEGIDETVELLREALLSEREWLGSVY
ncbi:MAG: hypothetical protein ACK46Q_01560 [Hyphomonas sp.]